MKRLDIAQRAERLDRMDLPQRGFNWLYRKLGRFYPPAFIVLEFQSAWMITLATIALFSFYYEAPKTDFLIIGGIALALTAATLAIAVVRTLRYIQPLRRWIEGVRDPEATERAWATAVGLPMEVIRRDMWLPIVGVALPGSIAAVVVLGVSPLAFFPIFAGSLVAIGYSAILHYFALEAGMRPVVVDMNRVLPPRLRTNVGALPLRFKLMAALPLINIITGVTVAALSSAGEGGGGAGLGADVLIATGVAFTISFELTVLLSKSIMRPIGDLEQGIEAVRDGRFEEAVPVTTADELGELSSAFNQMVAGLAERERIREAFGTYLDKEVAEYILSDGFAPEGFEAEVSILFCDVRDFTEFAGESDAQEVVSCLNSLFEAVVPVIAKHGGHVDKFVGDGLLAVFGAPEAFPDHADRAVRAAVEIAAHVNHGDNGLLEVGVGVNSGNVVAGSIGGAGRLNFSVIGDSVNVASRVEAMTRELDEDVLITDRTRQLLSGTVEVARRGPVELRGKSEPVELWAPVVETVEQSLPQGPSAHPGAARQDGNGERPVAEPAGERRASG